MRVYQILQRADNFSHGKPYMVTNLSNFEIVETIMYVHKSELHKYENNERYIVSDEINAFGNIKVIYLDKAYKDVRFFKTEKQAEQYVNKHKQ